MIKVLIVDDDFPVRMFLNKIIDWNKHGYELVGEAIDGREALEKIEKFKPHIVITDISMPSMNGIELIKNIREKKYGCKTIVLSCYDDFAYVKEALKHGANEYCLKNQLNDKILLKTLKETKNLIEKERVENGQYESMKDLANKCLKTLRQQFFREIINGSWKEKKDIREKIKELKLGDDLKNKIIMILEIDGFHKLKFGPHMRNRQILYNSIMNISKEILNDFNDGYVYRVTDKQFLILYSVHGEKSQLNMYKGMKEFAVRVQKNIQIYLNINMSIGISEPIYSLDRIDEYFNQCKMSLKSKFYMGDHKIILYKDIVKEISTDPIKISNREEKELIFYLRNCQYEKINYYIDLYVTGFKERNVKIEYVHNFFRRIILIINKVADEYDINPKDIYGEDTNPFRVIENMETIFDLIIWIKRNIEIVTGKLRPNDQNKFEHEVICEVIRYINCNYMKDITLVKVAEHVHMNMSYLSHLFKQQTKNNFVDYLKDVRIEKAKELMETHNKKISEIAELVGIRDRRYFSKLFKEKVGKSPAQYKKTIG
ncbi:response regulator transcription factor [Anaeromicrobium sediminis]|uniref:Stage 0 sporulation protein A homolog n=1 Tax=Anaeromicrobium sediminis TaxID=1478221 RepID=A0A267MJK2_9FIRM|nr:response regulator [Anaeromicrobium sediminis]PAB58960.1 hypothetical protein CCE28_12305 [Anaeromicrobium sediminis]